MIETLYIEEGVRIFPLSQRIISRFADARVVGCRHYGEVFNRKSQNFRLQKRAPALILAQKQGNFLLPVPDHYGIGNEHNYYFSHMLNCIYDCRYCFLQGMYRSANYVLFVNYDDFISAIRTLIENHNGKPVHFFSGYDCDSLALEPVTGFVKHFLPVFRDYADSLIELRTKSTQVRALLDMPVVDNAVIAFSFTPQRIARALEHKTPSVDRRLAAMAALQTRGWKVGIRYDPLIYTEDFGVQYTELIRHIHTRIDNRALHSVSLGAFRLPAGFFRTIHGLYPDEPLFAAGMGETAGMVAYRRDLQDHMMQHCRREISRHVATEKLYACHD